MALIWNFHPYSSGTKADKPFFPFEELNGFRYHDNWCNLLIAGSTNGY